MRYHVGEFIDEELKHRGWTTYECAAHACVGLEARDTLQLSLDILIAAAKAPEGHAALSLRLSDETADGLAAAFGTSRLLWINLDRAYHEEYRHCEECAALCEVEEDGSSTCVDCNARLTRAGDLEHEEQEDCER